jgi:hypothetical protein
MRNAGEELALSRYSFNNVPVIAQLADPKETSLDFSDKSLKYYRIIFLFMRIEFEPVVSEVSSTGRRNLFIILCS